MKSECFIPVLDSAQVDPQGRFQTPAGDPLFFTRSCSVHPCSIPCPLVMGCFLGSVLNSLLHPLVAGLVLSVLFGQEFQRIPDLIRTNVLAWCCNAAPSKCNCPGEK